jgi:hypothetical protein
MKNFFAPLRNPEMDIEHPVEEGFTQKPDGVPQQESSNRAGRPPPIVLSSTTNQIHLQRQLKGVVSENFEFRSTRNVTRVITISLADFQSVRSFFDSQCLSYFTFCPNLINLLRQLYATCP